MLKSDEYASIRSAVAAIPSDVSNDTVGAHAPKLEDMYRDSPDTGSTAAIERSSCPRSKASRHGRVVPGPQAEFRPRKCANRAFEAVDQRSPGTPLLCRSPVSSATRSCEERPRPEP